MKKPITIISIPSIRIILLSLLIQSILLSSAQAQRMEDVIYLSTGTIIHGTLLMDSSAGSIRILNHAGDIWVFDRTEVDSVKREKAFDYKAMLFNKPGPEFNINVELLMRSGSNAVGNAVIPGMNILFGYRFNPNVTAGADIGIAFFDRMEVPVSANLRLRSNNRILSPIIFIRAGYTLPAEKRADDWDYRYESFGGFHSSIGAGIERIISENTSFLFTFSYHYQELNYHLTPLHQWVQERDRTEAFSRLRLTVGYIFK